MNLDTKQLFPLVALTFVLALLLSFLLTSHTQASFPSVSAAAPRHIIEAKSNSADDEPQVVSIEITPSGFQPSETIAHHGKFLILVQNRSGNRDLRFYLIRENQERLSESQPQKRDWKAQVQLGPGTYVVGEASHPEWQSVIRVTN